MCLLANFNLHCGYPLCMQSPIIFHSLRSLYMSRAFTRLWPRVEATPAQLEVYTFQDTGLVNPKRFWGNVVLIWEVERSQKVLPPTRIYTDFEYCRNLSDLGNVHAAPQEKCLLFPRVDSRANQSFVLPGVRLLIALLVPACRLSKWIKILVCWKKYTPRSYMHPISSKWNRMQIQGALVFYFFRICLLLSISLEWDCSHFINFIFVTQLFHFMPLY